MPRSIGDGIREFKRHLRFVAGLPAFFRRPISYEGARETIRRRFSRREQRFVSFLDRAVFSNPSSPYLALMTSAGIRRGDVPGEVRRYGVEGFLRKLKEAGIWVAPEEYKGQRPLVRNGFARRFAPEDFDYPQPLGRLEIRSGGTSSIPAVSHYYLKSLAERACYDHLIFKMHGLYGVPLALWYPKLPAATGIGNSLRYAKIGHPPTVWFQLLEDRDTRAQLKSRMANRLILRLSRFGPFPIPEPQPVPFTRPEAIVSWIENMVSSRGRCVVQSYVSQAVRICQSATEKGVDLNHTLFIVGSEPLTPGKYKHIIGAGASVYSRYFSSELGSIGLGCGDPKDLGELHLLSDTVALVQGEETCSAAESTPFYLTVFSEAVPKVLINAQIGDGGIVEERHCNCLLGELGFNVHLRRVRNYALSNVEGMNMRAFMLQRITEELLPRMFGGSSLDFQWVEAEDLQAMTRLILRIHPRLGPLDEKALVAGLLREISRWDEPHRLFASVWKQAGSLRIERIPPAITQVGKQPLILRLESESLAEM